MKKYLPALLLVVLSGAVMAADGGNIVVSGKVVDLSCSLNVEAPVRKPAEAVAIEACAANIKEHMVVHLVSHAHLEKGELVRLDNAKIEPANAKVVFAAYL
ncbi:MAG: type 1 fimbrial protein [Neisseriaceae bacterium]|nr:type 1 fimbrial protein [Neisseriaceae bacterium]MBP6862547.1 type 1 fimbrial protein [Neisseriaceae bacterium]